jgi:phenylalanine-4-hydroxylase
MTLVSGYLSHVLGDPVHADSTQAERFVVKNIFEDDTEPMIARLGCLMVDNGLLEESESKGAWEGFARAVMLELDNRGYVRKGE